jgi:hypothetical protein
MYYFNYNKDDIERIEGDLVIIKDSMFIFLKEQGFINFSLNDKDPDFLGLDLHFFDIANFHYNLTILYEDFPKEYTFKIVLSKGIDIDDIRHFRKIPIVENVRVEMILDNIQEISDAIDIAKKWRLEDMEQMSLSEKKGLY